MKIKALKDFSYFYKGFNSQVKEGQEIEVEDKIALDFIRDGFAEEVKEAKIKREAK